VNNLVWANVPRFCDLFVGQEKFDRFSDMSVDLTCTFIRTSRKCDPAVRRMAIHFCGLFFKFPHHSFLHNAFLCFIRDLASVSLLTPELLREMDLFPKIVDAFRGRSGNVVSCFWGQLSKIAEIVSVHAARARVDVQVWRNEVLNVIHQNNGIIAHSYGGELPFSKVKGTNQGIFVLIAAVVLVLAILGSALPRLLTY
jgi:hypothetical protein